MKGKGKAFIADKNGYYVNIDMDKENVDPGEYKVSVIGLKGNKLNEKIPLTEEAQEIELKKDSKLILYVVIVLIILLIVSVSFIVIKKRNPYQIPVPREEKKYELRIYDPDRDLWLTCLISKELYRLGDCLDCTDTRTKNVLDNISAKISKDGSSVKLTLNSANKEYVLLKDNKVLEVPIEGGRHLCIIWIGKRD